MDGRREKVSLCRPCFYVMVLRRRTARLPGSGSMKHHAQKNDNSADLLAGVREGRKMSLPEQARMVFSLSLPAIMAQLSSIVMQYIDASMVGHLGSMQAAAVGMMAPATWLFSGLCTSVSIGFTVQTAQAIGGKRDAAARNLMKEGLVMGLCTAAVLALLGVILAFPMPVWLNGAPEVTGDATRYFFVYAFALPAVFLNYFCGGMLQASGNMKVPSALNIMMCFLDVIFNAVLIFPSRYVQIGGVRVFVPGAGLAVAGAALGTALAVLACSLLMLRAMLRADIYAKRSGERLVFNRSDISKAVKLALPVAFDTIIQDIAQVVQIAMISSLGAAAVAAHSLSVTAESFCYMPGYGIAVAASAIIGQSIGAKRDDMTRSLGYMITALGMGIMAVSGLLLFIFAPVLIGLLSPDPAIREAGTAVLRIIAFAEPFFGGAIVISGVLRGAGDTLIPSVMTFLCMWVVRLPLLYILSGRYGLSGAWAAMGIELFTRGVVFLLRLRGKKWSMA